MTLNLVRLVVVKEIGMMDEKEKKPFKRKLKDNFTETNFYKQ